MTRHGASEQDVALDRQTLARLRRVVGDFVASDRGGRAAMLAGLLLALLLAINGLNVVNSYVGRDFMTAIERRDGHAFITQAMRYALVFAVSTLAAVIYRFTEERLGLFWRQWFTARLADFYLDHQFYYRLKVDGGLANPDQRIADDVRAFTTTTLSLALVFLNGTFTVIAFSGVLWSISRSLFAVAAGYAILGSTVASVIGRPLVRLNYDQSDREADFRAQLVHVRENAESIALLRSEAPLRARLLDQVDALAANLKRIIAVNRNLSFFTTGYNYMIQLIPALVVAPLFINGSAQFGIIPQASMAFAQLIGAFSLIVNQLPQLTSYAAVLARLNALGEAYEASWAPSAGGIELVDDDRLACEELTLRAPLDDRPLVRQLSFAAPAGARVFIAVPDHLVLSAMQDVLADLWRRGSGRLRRPRAMTALPERPYLPPGSLRQALLGDRGPEADDAAPWAALRRVGVDDAVRRAGGLDAEHDWSSVFSLDELRLVNLAQLLLARPRFAVLASPSATFGAERAAQVLAALRESGVGYIVIEKGAAPAEPFDRVVSIAADGSWSEAGQRAS